MYDVALPAGRGEELCLRGVPEMLARLRALDGAPLHHARPPELRLLANARHFAVLLAALLRWQGIAARARCGFATYFDYGCFVDHWVCEVWDEAAGRWRRVDAQLDAVERAIYGVAFDALDVPVDRFLCAGRAWTLCREGHADAERFGQFKLGGMWFLRGNLVRDVAALNKVELLPWDAWGLTLVDETAITAAQMTLLDRAAAASMQARRVHLNSLGELYQHPGFRVPPVITSYAPSGPYEVALAL
jgi:hypothetical protein